MLSMLSVGIFEGIGNIFDILFDVLGAVFKGILALPMFLIYVGVMTVAYFSEIVFKKLAGIDPIYLNGKQLTGASGDGHDLVYGFITDTAVQNVFWSIVALSIVLLFICTIVALIKSEFTIDLKGSAKGPIIGRALKSLVNFITVPVVTIIAVIGTNFLTKSIYDMFGGEDSTIVTKCFYVGAYNANRARFSKAFASDMANNAYSAVTSSNNAVFNGTNPFAGKSQAQVADLIDQFFLEGAEITLDYNHVSFWNEAYKGNLIKQNATEAWEQGYVNWSLVLFGYPTTNNNVSLINLREVNFFYDLSEFNFVLSVGSGVVMAWLLLSVGVVLLKRVFELTILFLLAPAMTAIAPLDGGQSEKKWRGEFMKRLLAVIGPIFAYNMYFLMVPLFTNIKLFGSLSEVGGYAGGALGSISSLTAGASSMLGNVALMFAAFFTVFDVFFQLVCVFVGLSIVKSASALLSSLLGIEDLVKSGAENTKKAIDLGKKAALGATAVTGMAVRGAAAVVKTGGAIAKGAKNLVSKGGRSALKAKGELKGAEKEEKELDKEVEAEDKKVEAAENSIQKTNAYKENEAVIADLQGKLSEGVILDDDENKRLSRALDKRKLLNGESFADKTYQSDLAKELQKDGLKLKDIQNVRVAKKERDAKREEKEAKSKEVELLKKGISSDKQAEFYDSEGNLKEEKDFTDEQKKFAKQAASGGIIAHTKAAIAGEFGTDSQKTSSMGKLMNGEKYKKFSKAMSKVAPTAMTAIEQWLNPDNSESNTIKRRLNDALAGMFGDGGGGELWKIWFNKNARANLYEGVPESKKRSSNIEQSLSWGARDKWQKDEDAKKARNEQEKLIRRMLAYQKGGSFAEEYERYRKQRESETNEAQIKKLDAKIEKMEVSSGIAQQARNFYDQATPGSAKAKQLAEFKEMISDKAAKDAAKSERATKEKALKATVATADKPLDVKLGDTSVNKLADAIRRGSKGENNSIKELIDSMKEMNGSNDMKAVLEALNRLVESIEKKL